MANAVQVRNDQQRQYYIQDPWERVEELETFIKKFPDSPLCECCRHELEILEEKEGV